MSTTEAVILVQGRKKRRHGHVMQQPAVLYCKTSNSYKPISVTSGGTAAVVTKIMVPFAATFSWHDRNEASILSMFPIFVIINASAPPPPI